MAPYHQLPLEDCKKIPCNGICTECSLMQIISRAANQTITVHNKAQEIIKTLQQYDTPTQVSIAAAVFSETLNINILEKTQELHRILQFPHKPQGLQILTAEQAKKVLENDPDIPDEVRTQLLELITRLETELYGSRKKKSTIIEVE